MTTHRENRANHRRICEEPFLSLPLRFAIPSPAHAAVNIISATREELTSIKGIGAERAQDIIDYRTKNGPLKASTISRKSRGSGPGS
jgi:competence protein ComEA